MGYTPQNSDTSNYVSGDTPVLMDVGGILRLVTVSNICDDKGLQEDGSLLSMDMRGGISLSPSGRPKPHGGVGSSYVVETDEGYSMRVSGGPSLISYADGVVVNINPANAKPKDHLAFPFSLPRRDLVSFVGHGRGKIQIGNREAHFIGTYIGANARLTSRVRAEVMLNEAWRVDRLASDTDALGGKRRIIRDSSGYTVIISGGKAMSIIRYLSSVPNFELPEFVFNVNRRIQMAFLNGFFTAAGCVSRDHNDRYSLSCHMNSSITDAMVTILRQMSLWPRVYRSSSHSLIELSHKNAEAMTSALSSQDRVRHAPYRLLRVKNVTKIDDVTDMYRMPVLNCVIGSGGFLLSGCTEN